ncbi:hypothetical protein [Ornithinimicrobium cryptoxanthini]|uniref:hypothetical protein n=1 Tax=Ornithinimicrobium cryptoxanthini TaxID=2934161 RepID=UPI002118F241|nr:hypothetical protein [Ornithinimicrobium cryptoxanthini]
MSAASFLKVVWIYLRDNAGTLERPLVSEVGPWTALTPGSLGRMAETGDARARSLRQAILTVGIVLILAEALRAVYRHRVAPFFDYQGLGYRAPEPLEYGTALFVLLTVALLLPRRIRVVSDFLVWMVFALAVAPSVLLAQYMPTLQPTQATVMGVVMGACMLLIRWGAALDPVKTLPVRRIDTGINFWGLLALVSALTYAVLVATNGLHVRFLSFDDVYSVRDEFSLAASGSFVMAYLLPWQSNVINPLFMARGILARKWGTLTLGVGGQLLIYSSVGSKGDLFVIPVVVALALLFRYRTVILGRTILLAVTAACTLALALDQVTDSIVWSSLIVRRVMVVPGALTAAYVDVFSQLPKANFAEVIPLIPDPYASEPMHPVHIVGLLFVGNADTAANVNLFGHGFLQYGYPGMVVESLVLIVMLWLANAATRGLPLPAACIVFFSQGIALISSSVFTTALSHGFGFAVLVCALAPVTGWARRARASGPDPRPRPARKSPARRRTAPTRS